MLIEVAIVSWHYVVTTLSYVTVLSLQIFQDNITEIDDIGNTTFVRWFAELFLVFLDKFINFAQRLNFLGKNGDIFLYFHYQLHIHVCGVMDWNDLSKRPIAHDLANFVSSFDQFALKRWPSKSFTVIRISAKTSHH